MSFVLKMVTDWLLYVLLYFLPFYLSSLPKFATRLKVAKTIDYKLKFKL